MRKTKLVRILSTLKRSELRRLKEFVNSPFFNKNTNIQRLMDYLLRYAPDFDTIGLTEEAAYAYVFEGDLFKEKVITKLSSKLYKLLCQFIKVEFGEYESVEGEVQFLEFLGERELNNEYELHLKQVQKSIEIITMRDTKYFYKEFLVQQEISKRISGKENRKNGTSNIQATSNALDKYYLITKLIYLCQQHNEGIIKPKGHHDFELMKELEAYIPSSPYYEVPTIKIWFTALQLLRNDDKHTLYLELRGLIFQHYKLLNELDLFNVITFLHNNARFVYLNKDDYYNEIFELYKFKLEKGIFNNPVIFTPSSFLNIVMTALLLNKKDWTASFLGDRKDYDQNREDTVHCLSAAMLSFERGAYAQAQGFLNTCKFKNIYFKLSERRLWMKVFYEQDMHDQVEHQVNSFRKFISTNKKMITDFHLIANRNFINILNQIFNVIKTDKQRIAELRQEVNQTRALPEKRWILNKIKDLE